MRPADVRHLAQGFLAVVLLTDLLGLVVAAYTLAWTAAR